MSKFQIVKGITDNLTETPYVEGKVYFVYDDIASTDLSIYADIDGARRKITPTTFEEEDPKIHILTLQEDENEELTTGEDDSISSYVNNNELVIIYYGGKPYFYNKNSDRGYDFDGINGNYMRYYYSTTENKMMWHISNDDHYLTQYDLPTNVSNFNNDAGYITQETDPTVPAWAKESTKPTYTAAEVGALPDTTVIPENKVFIIRYTNTTKTADKTYSEIQTAVSNGKFIYLRDSYSRTFYLISSDLGYHFINFNGLRTSDNQGNELHSFTEYNLNSQNTWTEYSWTVPYQLSQLTNDSGFQTSTEVNSAIATAIGNINQFNVAIVSTLPTENIDAHTIYFMSNGGSDDSIYDEWMYINNNWEKIGTTSIDLSGYMQTSHPANGISATDISNWNNKADIWDIASGVGSSGDSDTFSINMSNYYGNYDTNFMVFVNKRQLIGNSTQIRYTTNSLDNQLEIKKDKVIIDGAAADAYIQPGLYYGTLSVWSNSATLTLTKAPITSDIPDVSGYVSKSGDTMTGQLTTSFNATYRYNGGIKFKNDNNYSDIILSADLGYYNSSTDTDYPRISFMRTNGIGYVLLGGIDNPVANKDAANKQYVDNAIPKVYSSTNTNGYLTMATLPIYDGTVE